MNLPIKHIPEVKRLIVNCREYTTAFNYCGLISGARADEVFSLCDEMEAAINKQINGQRGGQANE